MSALRFTAKMEIRGINPYVLVSAARARKLQPDWRKPMPVLVRIDGQPREAWRINMMPAGDGSFYLYLSEVVRKASGTVVGDRVAVEVEFDADYQGGPAGAGPAWFLKALKASPAAKAHWQALPPSRQKEVLRNMAKLKTDAAQQRNLEKALHVLSGKPGRFLAREWRDGR
ncbi:YdeI/OmpD-associated family protein [uncultured Ramlibacter sp.]|uniref:YdeI/OmpD-associated family protein n=1 Tax=uncultured Ramlibacter sp. TaxID=260755 RepID=UPI0026248C10|nr:YdeI/OmpD-associated family protein [uncultured Ramlibacter sp.]